VHTADKEGSTMKKANRSSVKRRLTPQLLFDELMAAYPMINYGKTRKIRALAKQRGVSVEAMLLELLRLGLKKMTEKDALSTKERGLLARIQKCAETVARDERR
jgi:Zn-dependent peptidase ImmA (M78 family)